MSSSTAVTLSTLATVDEDQEALQRMNIIVRADATGTLEAVKGALRGLPQDSIALRLLLTSTGPITPSDIELARTSSAFVVGFNVELPESSAAAAKQAGIDVQTYDVIYDLLDDVRARMEGKIKAVMEKVECGAAEVKATFGKGKSIIGGCLVTQGRLVRGGLIEVRRGRKKLVYEGELSSLRRFKDEVKIVEEGVECGVGCNEFWEWEEGDKITCFELVEKTLTLEESHADRAVDSLDDAMAELSAEYLASLEKKDAPMSAKP
jgi:translation initiation factor IF-2